MSNIVDAYPREGVVFRTKPLFQWDWGQIVRLHISDLPAAYKVEFSNSTRADAVSTVQTTDEVTVPAQFLESGNPVYAWVVVVDEARTTEYSLIIPVSARAKPTDLEPSPEEQTEIEQTLSALNQAVSDVQEIADAIPDTINEALEAAKESGEFDGPQGPQGEKGDKGDTGAQGPQGIPGDDYVLTAADKTEIAQQAAEDVDVPVQDVQVNGASILDAQGVANITPADLSFTTHVTGTTPSITALPGIQYVCGEVSTLGITLPASGCIDVVFQSGSTPTVLTITPPTGVTIKWANGFNPTSLEANATYEINIMNGLGVAASWT